MLIRACYMWFFSLQNLKNQPVAKLVFAKFIIKHVSEKTITCMQITDNLHAITARPIMKKQQTTFINFTMIDE